MCSTELCGGQCFQHSHLRHCGDLDSYDGCHNELHCRWMPSLELQQNMEINAQNILRKSYCTALGTLTSEIKESYNTSSQACAKIMNCSESSPWKDCRNYKSESGEEAEWRSKGYSLLMHILV